MCRHNFCVCRVLCCSAATHADMRHRHRGHAAHGAINSVRIAWRAWRARSRAYCLRGVWLQQHRGRVSRARTICCAQVVLEPRPREIDREKLEPQEGQLPRVLHGFYSILILIRYKRRARASRTNARLVFRDNNSRFRSTQQPVPQKNNNRRCRVFCCWCGGQWFRGSDTQRGGTCCN